MQDGQPTGRIGRGSISGGLILIVLGFLWLLNNLGYLPGDLLRSLWRLWPLILILLGTEVALRGFPDRVALPVLLLVTILIGSVLLVLGPTLPAEQMLSESFSQELGGLQSASVDLELDNGVLSIEPLQDQPHLLATAQWDHVSSVLIQKEFTESSGRGSLSLADRYEAFFPFFFLGGLENDWSLQLTRDIPLDLEIEADDCSLELLLDGLTLTALTGQWDDCTGEVRLPTSDNLDAQLDVGDSRLTIAFPSTVGARLTTKLSDSYLDFDPPRFVELSPEEYLSEGYDQAQIRMDVSLEAVDSTITIQ
jgi:hypothetical protein